MQGSAEACWMAQLNFCGLDLLGGRGSRAAGWWLNSNLLVLKAERLIKQAFLDRTIEVAVAWLSSHV